MAGVDPFAAHAAARANDDPFAAHAAARGSGDPFAGHAAVRDGDPFAGHGRNRLAQTAANIGDVLDAPRRTTQDWIFHKGSSDANREALRAATGLKKDYDDPRLFGTGPGSFGIPVPDWATHLGRGLTDTVIDTETDPLSLIGGLVGGAVKGGAALLGRGAKAAESLPLVGGTVGEANSFGQLLAHKAQDYFTHGGAATREVGKEGVDVAMGAKTKTASHSDQLDKLLQARFAKIRAGMTDEEFGTALQIQKGERQAHTNEGRPLVSEATIAGAAALKHLFKQAYALRADASGQRVIADYTSAARPATAQTVTTAGQRNAAGRLIGVRPKINEVEATRDIEQNNAARARVISAYAKDALPTIEQHPDFISALQADRDYRVGGKGFSEEQIAKNAEKRKALLAHRLAGDRFRALSPEEQEQLTINAGGTRRVQSTGGNRYVSNRGTAWDPKAADPIDKDIKPLVDAQRPIIDKTRPTYKVTARAPSTPYKIDEDLAEFAGQPGTLSAKQHRQNYVPGPRDPKAIDPNKPADSFNLLEKSDPNAEHQGPFTIDPAQPGKFADAISRMLSNTASQVGRAELHKELAQHFGGSLPAEISKLFDVTTKATGTARTSGEALRDKWRSIVDYPKSSVVGWSPRHAFNVASLGALNDPVALAKALPQAARILKNPALRYEELRPGIEAGAIGPRASHDLTAPGWLNKLSAQPGGLGALGRGVGAVRQGINDATWALDESTVNQLAKAKGGDYAAGRDARKALVDYDNPSRFTQHAKNFAPFATFESSIPGAVGKAIARDPRGVEIANRLTGGTLLGGNTQIGGADVSLGLPTAKVGRLLGSGDLAEYGRGALADPLRAAFSFALSLTHLDKYHYLTYGLDPRKPADLFKIVANAATAGIPESREILQQLGLGSYKPTQNIFQSLGQGMTGVRIH